MFYKLNKAATVITGRENEHGQSELALDELKWKPLSERKTHFVASLVYKITHVSAVARTIIAGAHIHIFVFTYHKNN